MADAQPIFNQVAIVTGVSRLKGIAAAVVRRLALSGWDVAMTGWPTYDESFSRGADPGGPEQLLSEITAHGRRGIYLAADLSAVSAPGELFDRTQQALGPVTALVVVHAYDPGGGVFDVTADEFDRHIAINPGPNDTGWMDERTRDWAAGQSPPGRVGKPDDAAELVAFRCSSHGGWITGQVLNSDGGWSRLRT